MIPTWFHDVGLIDYKQCWDYQEELFGGIVQQKIANRKAEKAAAQEGTEPQLQATENHLIFCEHPHVYTLGKSGDFSNLLLDEDGLKAADATYYKINRGGDITYHGPGQIVGYPIIDLEYFFTDLHRYLRTLEEAIIRTIAHYGLKGDRYPGYTGVWLEPETDRARKICAMGVRSSRWVTMHGFAFNVNTNLDYFGNIIPCGIDDKDVTSMQRELGHEVEMEAVKKLLKQEIAAQFGMELKDAPQG